MARLALSAALCCLVACASSHVDRAWVRAELQQRLVSTAAHAPDLRRLAARTLSEDQAVALALARSPAYRADLARLDSARADLAEARRPSNPQLTLLGALGPVSAMATLLAPLESLWQAPMRSEAAARAVEAVAHSLLQSGLDLARDVRLAYVARCLSEERERRRGTLAALGAKLSELADARVRIGEAAGAEATALHAEAALARDAHEVSASERTIARATLRTLLGLDVREPAFDVVFERALESPPTLPVLSALARRARPDVRAAELALLAAGARLGWERSRVVVVAAQLEGHWTRPDTFAARLGGRVELPIFGLNPGGIGRAHAELARAQATWLSLRQRVRLEIVQAQTRAQQSQSSLARYRREVLPDLEAAHAASVQGYELGEDSYLVVLDLLRRLSEARLREAELVADTRRAWAELERAVGGHIGGRT